MHDNKSQWFIQVFCGVLTAFALFIPMPAMVFAEDEQQEYVQESGQDVPESELSEKVGEIHTEDYTEGWVLIDDKSHWQYADGTFAYNTWIDSYYLTSSGAWDPSVAYDNIYTWPCPGYTRISSDYGPRPRPTAGASSYHRGIDISAPEGATVTSIHRGTVQSYGYNGTMGNYVKISHGNGVASVYMHMSRIANIHTGMSVSAGTTIGYVGSTGVATGAHLHLGILLNGNYVSPWNYISRP